jgi:hypothetical protein
MVPGEHLAKAASELSAGHFAGSVRESIHAVESVVRVLESGGDFGKALSTLEKKVKIHGALKAGFKSIYGFTSDGGLTNRSGSRDRTCNQFLSRRLSPAVGNF